MAFENKLLHLFLESHRPIKNLNPMVTPGIGVQIVNNIAATDDQNAFLSKGREPFAYFIMESGGGCLSSMLS